MRYRPLHAQRMPVGFTVIIQVTTASSRAGWGWIMLENKRSLKIRGHWAAAVLPTDSG
jgi:hypothetical protein